MRTLAYAFAEAARLFCLLMLLATPGGRDGIAWGLRWTQAADRWAARADRAWTAGVDA